MEGDLHENWNLGCRFSCVKVEHVSQCSRSCLLSALLSLVWSKCLCCLVVGPAELIWVKTNSAKRLLLIQRTEEFFPQCSLSLNVYSSMSKEGELGVPAETWKQCQHWTRASEAISSSKTPCGKGVKCRKGTAEASCLYFQTFSYLVRNLERCAVTVRLSASKEAPYFIFFLWKLPHCWVFFIAWECVGALDHR